MRPPDDFVPRFESPVELRCDRVDEAMVVPSKSVVRAVWLPGFGFSNIDSVTVQQGRTIYAGLQYSVGKR
jgi:hypothetical protein